MPNDNTITLPFDSSAYKSHWYFLVPVTTLHDLWKRHGLPTYYECTDSLGLRYDKYMGEPFGLNAVVDSYRYLTFEGDGLGLDVRLKEVRS